MSSTSTILLHFYWIVFGFNTHCFKREFTLSPPLNIIKFSSSQHFYLETTILGTCRAFSLFLSHSLPVFSSSHASLIILEMCESLGAERVYQKLAAELKEEKDLNFALIMEQNLAYFTGVI